MLHVLLESTPRSARHLGWAMGSAGGHVAIIALAIVATGQEPAPAPDQPPVVTFIPIAPSRITTPPTGRPAPAAGNPTIAPLKAPTIIPTDIPPVVLGSAQLPTDPTQYFGTGFPLVEGDTAAAPAICEQRFVEKAVLARPGNASPRYPDMLRSSGIGGEVIMHFVVDTLGVPEPGSLVVMSATHPAFVPPVRDALLRSRFLPASIGARPVRQLVEQRFVFSIR